MNNLVHGTGLVRRPPLRANRGAALLLVLMVLVIMTLMLFFNARVTSYEQAISGNDQRARLAHHAAEAGISHAMRFFTRNLRKINSVEGDGWLAVGGANRHWLPCSANDTTLPCAAASLAADGRADGFSRENVFYYVEDADAENPNTYLPLSSLVTEYDDSDPPVPIDNTDYRVQALLCVMDYDQDKYESGNTDTYAKCDQSGTPSSIHLALRLVSTGTADDGTGRAIITQTLANVEPGGGPPSVPIMTYNSVAPNGTINVVANPNAAALFGKYQRRALGDRDAAIATFSAALDIARKADNGYSTSFTPTSASSLVVNIGVLPNSVRLASTGTFTASVN